VLNWPARWSARRNDAACYKLAKFYADGVGCDRSQADALRWLTTASNRG
jgi:TPR repeat protein